MLLVLNRDPAAAAFVDASSFALPADTDDAYCSDELRLYGVVQVLRIARARALVDSEVFSKGVGAGTVAELFAQLPWLSTEPELAAALAWETDATTLPAPRFVVPESCRLSPADFTQALLHSDKELRLAAVDLLCNASQSSIMPTSLELHLVRIVVAAVLKSSLSDVKQRMCTYIDRFLQRLFDSSRPSRKRLQWLALLRTHGPVAAGA